MFACLECGKKFKSDRAAERAIHNGCPGCGGSDIDLDTSTPSKESRYERFKRARAEADEESTETLEAASDMFEKLVGVVVEVF